MSAGLATSLWQGFRQIVMPGVCLACHELLSADRNDFCTGCERQFSDDPHPTCPRCSGTVGPHTDLSAGCPNCRSESFAFDRAVRLGPYDGLLRGLILRMKQAGNAGLAEGVGEVWSRRQENSVRELGIEVIIPVPLHWWRRWQRGFNQSELLARAWGERLRLPCRPGWLRRVRPTVMQTSLPPTARRENVRSAFSAVTTAGLRGRTVLLIDDVMTTGSTAHEAARALRDAGARAVTLAVLAHGR